MSILTAPHLHRLGPEAARDLSREVLLTDGLGGFALSSPAGVPTRRYSGLSVSHRPPGERRIMFVSALETLRVGDRSCELHAFEVAPGTTEGQGLSVLSGVKLRDLLPEREQFSLGLRIRRRSVMPRHSGALVLLYDIEAPHLRIGDEASLTLGALLVDRDMHAVQASSPDLRFEAAGNTVRVHGAAHQTRLYLHCADSGAETTALSIAPQPQRVHYRFDEGRGEASTDRATRADLWSIELLPGLNRIALVIEGLEAHIDDPWAAYDQEAERRAGLVSQAFAASGVRDEVVATLSVAADAFLVYRRSTDSPSVIAGYPWFADWGRDSMIALRGLTLLTGRLQEGLGVLDTFLNSLRGGLIPNNFHDDGAGAGGTGGAGASAGAGYNTVDGSLWLASTLEKLVEASGNPALARMALGAVRGILGEYARGAAHGIGMDNADGLLSAGQAGSQLTWMDAKVHDWVVTPRHGKPVEVQALWLSALGAESRLSGVVGEESEFSGVLRAARHAFAQFWNPATNYLHDVLAPSHPESSLYWQGPHAAPPPNSQIRPNALLALSLPDTPASPGQVGAALSVAARDLLTPLGLRTLSPSDPEYRSDYGGHRLTRDAAYHQGTVWPWLIGAYTELSLQQDQVQEARAALGGLLGHLWEAGLGSVSEVASAGSLTPGGCPFQAWSVAELLRAHVMVSLAERAQVQASQGALRAQAQPVQASGKPKGKAGKPKAALPQVPSAAAPANLPPSLPDGVPSGLPPLPSLPRAADSLPDVNPPVSTPPLPALPELPRPPGSERGPAGNRLSRFGALNLPPSTLGDIGSSTLGPAELMPSSGLMGLALMPGPLPGLLSGSLPQSPPHLTGQARPNRAPTELDEPLTVEDPDVIEPLT